MKQKTKLGIPVTIMAALIFFCGIESGLIMIGLILYTLCLEENAFLKKAAKQALAIFLIFSVISGGLAVVGRVVAFIGNVTRENYVIPSVITIVLSFIEYLAYFIFGVEALLNKNGKAAIIDHIMEEQPTPEPMRPHAATAENQGGDGKFCLNCGAKLSADAGFCTACGTKQQ